MSGIVAILFCGIVSWSPMPLKANECLSAHIATKEDGVDWLRAYIRNRSWQSLHVS